MGRLRVLFAFVALSFIWGSSYLFIRIGVRQLTPLTLVSFRLLIGAVGVLVLAALSRQNLRVTRGQLVRLAILCNFNTAISFVLISWGETHISSGLAAVFNSTTPIFSVLVAGLVLHDERLTAARLAGVLLGFVGVVVLASRDLGGGGLNWLGILSQGAVVVASALYGIGAVYARYNFRGVPSLTVAVYTVSFSAIEISVVNALVGFPLPAHPSDATIFALLWLGLLGSALAYVLYYVIIDNWGAGRATLVTYMIPPIGLALGAIFLGEMVDWRIIVGSALVVLGVVLASLTRLPSRAPAQEDAVA